MLLFLALLFSQQILSVSDVMESVKAMHCGLASQAAQHAAAVVPLTPVSDVVPITAPPRFTSSNAQLPLSADPTDDTLAAARTSSTCCTVGAGSLGILLGASTRTRGCVPASRQCQPARALAEWSPHDHI
jgi:hypothetical protein